MSQYNNVSLNVVSRRIQNQDTSSSLLAKRLYRHSVSRAVFMLTFEILEYSPYHETER